MTTQWVPGQGFRIWSLGSLPIVTPPAEVDVASAEAFSVALMAATRDQATVVVDMTSTEFCDSGGIGRPEPVQAER